MNSKGLIDNERRELRIVARFLGYVLSVGLFSIIFVLYLYFRKFHGELSGQHEMWGTFGDYFGGILNPLLSFLALVSLLITIYFQAKQVQISARELKLSREEMEETRKELRRSAEAQEKVEKAAAKHAKASEIAARISAVTQLIQQNDDALNNIRNMASQDGIDTRDKAMKNKEMLYCDLSDLYVELKKMSDS